MKDKRLYSIYDYVLEAWPALGETEIERHKGTDWDTAKLESAPVLDLMQELIDSLRADYSRGWVRQPWTDSGIYTWSSDYTSMYDHGFREWSQQVDKKRRGKNPCPMKCP